MVRTLPLGLQEALKMTLDRVESLEATRVGLLDGLNRVLAEEIVAKVDSPSIDASMKDGFAVMSNDVHAATREHPIRLNLVDSLAAGDGRRIQMMPKTAIRVLTGARIPTGADAVVADEYTQWKDKTVTIYKNAEPGRNILPKSSDVSSGQVVAGKGRVVTPAVAGMLAAAGHSHISVVRRPSVAVIATGDEVVAPGRPLPEGKLYASNMTTLGGWCRKYGMHIHMDVVEDDDAAIYRMLEQRIGIDDAIVTSGGAWTSDRDLIARVLEQLGWQQVFHRIRIGPGKAVGFGILKNKPIFILPGGPPSNLIGFLQIALPGLLTLAGYRRPRLPEMSVRLASELIGRYADWTQFVFGTTHKEGDILLFRPLKDKSRLRSMADAHAVVAIAEGKTVLPAGSIVAAQLLE